MAEHSRDDVTVGRRFPIVGSKFSLVSIASTLELTLNLTHNILTSLEMKKCNVVKRSRFG